MNDDLKEDFNKGAPSTLEGLLARAEMLTLTYFAISHPAQNLYDRFSAAVDAYATALVTKYGSLQNYIDEKEQALQALAVRKGAATDGAILDFDEGAKKSIVMWNEAIFDKNKFLSSERFAEMFVWKIPGTIDALTKRLNALPDAPQSPKQLDLDF